MNTKINVGVVGLGRLGALYARYLHGRIPGAKVAAVMDIRADVAKQIGEELGGAKVYTDYRELANDPGVQAIVVTTPTKLHKDVVIAAAEAGKAIFCEKPLALDIDESIAMKKAVDKAGVFFQLGFMRRFDKAYATAWRKIQDGVIGTPITFKSTSRDQFPPPIDYLRPESSGGVFIDMGIHDFDLARWFMGEATHVFSVGTAKAYPEIGEVGDVDNALVSLNFANSAIGSISLSRSGIFGYSITTEIVGTKGTIQIGYDQGTAIQVMTKDAITHDTVPDFFERFDQAYITQLVDFVNNLHSGKAAPITCDDGIAAQRLAMAATRSLRSRIPEQP